MRAGTMRGWHLVHKWTGLVATAFLLMLCITGLPLIFHEEIERHFEGEAVLPSVPPGTGAPALQAALEATLAARGDSRVNFILFDADLPVATVGTGRNGVPAEGRSGRIDLRTGLPLADLPHGESPAGTIMDVVLRLHTDLFAGLPGLLFLGFMGLLLAAATISGVVLYGPFMRRLAFGTVRCDRGPRRRWLDLHNLLGIATAAWVLVVGLTGTINAVERPIGMLWRATELQPMLAAHRHAAPIATPAPIDRVLATAREAAPGMTPVSVVFPGLEVSGPGHFLVVMTGTEHLTRRLYRTLLIDGGTAALADGPRMPWYVQALHLSQPLHFGDYGGLPLKILWAALDLIAIAVLGSGLYLWLRRPARRPRR